MFISQKGKLSDSGASANVHLFYAPPFYRRLTGGLIKTYIAFLPAKFTSIAKVFAKMFQNPFEDSKQSDCPKFVFMKLMLHLIALFFALPSFAQNDSFYLLKPMQVFDGEQMHRDWIVLVKGNKIEAAGSMNFKLPANTRVIEFTRHDAYTWIN